MMVGGVVMAMREDLGLSWLLIVAIPALVLSVSYRGHPDGAGFRSMQVRIDDVNRLLREQITGVRVVRAFVREPHETERFADVNAELTKVAVRAGRWQAVLFPTVMLILNVSMVAVHLVRRSPGGQRRDAGRRADRLHGLPGADPDLGHDGDLHADDDPARVGVRRPDRRGAGHRDLGRVAREPDRAAARARSARAPTGVEFSYPGAEAPGAPGHLLRGAPGSDGGADRLHRRRQEHAGQPGPAAVRCHAAARSSWVARTSAISTPMLLWSQIGLVPQKAYLFSGTIASNLRYGNPEASDEELWTALEVAQAADFVAAMPDGLDAPISQGGTNVSGGQRQRLAIARAILRKPKIYLFDDSFSALDLATDARLRAALVPLTREATVLIVAQRVSTIRDADLILVLDDGLIVGRGTHDELLEHCPTYQEIVSSQLSAEEAA